MSKFRTKPFEIEAEQLTKAVGSEARIIIPDWERYPGMFPGVKPIGNNVAGEFECLGFNVKTANGWVFAAPGDWLIREPSGVGCYPCKPDVFAAKYEPSDA